MRILAGTSGYSYKEWHGPFYPPKLAAGKRLEFYASRLPTVEINNTFYRMPRRSMLEGWAQQVPDAFRFVLKAPRRITHIKRLQDAAEETGFLLQTAAALGERLGPLLFQLPPFQRRELDRLRGFLELLPAAGRHAFEFRHASWFEPSVYGLLREHNAALCIADTDEAPLDAITATADWGYLRLRRADYDEAALSRWVREVLGQAWSESYVFFKHEDAGTGARLALRFLELAGS